jgi:hypothetical protein
LSIKDRLKANIKTVPEKKNCGITFLSGAIDERGSFRKGEKENKNEAFLNTSRHSFYSFHDKEVL